MRGSRFVTRCSTGAAASAGIAYFAMNARSTRSFHRQTQSPSATNRPREAIACRSPVEISASACRCGRYLRSGDRVRVRGEDSRQARGPACTANTPDFGRGRPRCEAQSPAANTNGCDVERRWSSTSTKPSPSHASPDARRPGRRCRRCRPHDAIDGDAPAMRDDDACRARPPLRRLQGAARRRARPGCGRGAREPPPRACGSNVGLVGDERESRRSRRASSRRAGAASRAGAPRRRRRRRRRRSCERLRSALRSATPSTRAGTRRTAWREA